MKPKIITFILLLYVISVAYEMQIRSAIVEGCTNGWLRHVESITGVCDLMSHFVNINKTEKEIEEILLTIAQEEFDEFKKDTSYDKLLIGCIALILKKSDSKESDVFIKELYKTGNPLFVNITLDYMINISDEWFTCSKNIIDSISTKDYMLRYKLYIYLNERLNKYESEKDTLKYLFYNALEKEHWGHVIYIDSIYSAIEPEYITSKQRLKILSKLDNDTVKAHIEIGNKKVKEKKMNTYEDRTNAYITYQKLKKARKLKNYIPIQKLNRTQDTKK